MSGIKITYRSVVVPRDDMLIHLECGGIMIPTGKMVSIGAGEFEEVKCDKCGFVSDPTDTENLIT